MVAAVPGPRALLAAAATMEQLGNAEAAAAYRQRAREQVTVAGASRAGTSAR